MLLKVLFSVSLAWAAPGEDPRWLRLYQYERTALGNWQSPITSQSFFFSPDGPQDPEAELRAAVQAYSTPELKFGVQKFSAACAFPARKIILEELLGISFPKSSCPDLDAWLERIGANQINLVFVGAYPGNPASLLGHTFIRFANTRSELLHYSVGYMAITDPSDSRWTYMVKGISGGYDGFYEIEPHYMKVGLYNNSESRDLWEVTLKLTSKEVDLLVRHFWELTFNAKSPYYFIDENCSYRLIQFLEVLRPSLNLTARFPLVVLPAETVRAAVQAGLAEPAPRFRPSVKRRMAYKLSLLDEPGRAAALAARHSVEKTKALTDPTAIDALLDYWLYENYRARTALSPEQTDIMEATFTQAATLKSESRFKNTSSEQVREKFELTPPFLGHPPSWIELGLGGSRQGPVGGLKYRNGAHPMWSDDSAYDGAAAIEFLGAEIQWREGEKTRWSLLLIDVKALNEFSVWEKQPSWTFAIDFGNHCRLCATEKFQAHAKGGVGVTFGGGKSGVIYLMAHMDAAAWSEVTPQGYLAPGFVGGLKTQIAKQSFTAEITHHWWRARGEFTASLSATHPMTRDSHLIARLLYEDGRPTDFEISSSLGWALFF